MSGDAVYLIDMKGEVVHRWLPDAGSKFFYGQLLPNGNLLTNITDGTEIGEPAGPRTAVVAGAGLAGQYGLELRPPGASSRPQPPGQRKHDGPGNRRALA